MYSDNNDIIQVLTSSSYNNVLTAIVKYNYYVCFEQDSSYTNIEIRFVIQINQNEPFYQMDVRFRNVSSQKIMFCGSNVVHLEGFVIDDMKDRGYAKENRFHVNDFEDQKIDFYCESYEFINIEILDDYRTKA